MKIYIQNADIGVGKKVILKWWLRKYGVRMWTGLIGTLFSRR
jgi:hypothetical protein